MYTAEIEALEAKVLAKTITDDDFIDIIVKAITNSPGAPALLHDISEQLYDRDTRTSPINTYPEPELHAAILALNTGCLNRGDKRTTAYLSLLARLMEHEDKFDLLIRWTLSRLVGIAIAREESEH